MLNRFVIEIKRFTVPHVWYEVWCSLTKNSTNFVLWWEILLNWKLIFFLRRKIYFRVPMLPKLSGQLPPRKISPWWGLGLGLILEPAGGGGGGVYFGGGGGGGAIFLEGNCPRTIAKQFFWIAYFTIYSLLKHFLRIYIETWNLTFI